MAGSRKKKKGLIILLEVVLIAIIVALMVLIGFSTQEKGHEMLIALEVPCVIAIAIIIFKFRDWFRR